MPGGKRAYYDEFGVYEYSYELFESFYKASVETSAISVSQGRDSTFLTQLGFVTAAF